jgi:lipopolysaccharide/colanic/teichoic acid biosynthesis glycosyltransferase
MKEARSSVTGCDMLIRFFDIFFSLLAMVILFPFMIPVMIDLKATGEHI